MNKPLVIQLREAKDQLIEGINTAIRGGIPCFLLEPIVAELHRQVSQSAQAEYENALKQQAAENAQTKEEGGETDGP